MGNSINELECIIKWERNVKIICADLNNFIDLKYALIIFINYIEMLTDCEAVSIRLHDDEDYSYYVYSDLPESFIEKIAFVQKNKDWRYLKYNNMDIQRMILMGLIYQMNLKIFRGKHVKYKN